MPLEITIFNSVLPWLWQSQKVIWIQRCCSSAVAQVVPEVQTLWIVFEPLLFFKCPPYGSGEKKEREKKKKCSDYKPVWVEGYCYFCFAYISPVAEEKFSSTAFKEVWRNEGLYLEIPASLSHSYRRDYLLSSVQGSGMGLRRPEFSCHCHRCLGWHLARHLGWLFKAHFNRRICLKTWASVDASVGHCQMPSAGCKEYNYMMLKKQSHMMGHNRNVSSQVRSNPNSNATGCHKRWKENNRHVSCQLMRDVIHCGLCLTNSLEFP